MDYSKAIREPTVRNLIIANAITMFIALYYNWNPAELLWIYWGQGIIIGLFSVIKMIKVKGHGILSFCFQFGLVNLIYAPFLLLYSSLSKIDLTSFALGFIISMVVFFINHLISYMKYENQESFENTTYDIGKKTFARVIPMHLTLALFPLIWTILSGWYVILLFIIIKTVIDVKGHISKHRL